MAERNNTQFIALGVAGTLVIYLLSFPFWIWLDEPLRYLGCSPSVIDAIDAFYTPANWLFLLLSPYEWYVRAMTERLGIYLAHQQ